MMAYSAMFAASFETTIGSYARFNMQKTWDAVLATPVSLIELLLGEAFWAAAKALFSAVCVLVVGVIWGGIGWLAGALLSLPLIFIASFAFAACGLAATAHAKTWEFFSYFFTFWVTPMFVFSGVFFGIDRFPGYVQPVVWVLPMTHVIEVIRPLTAGQPLALPGPRPLQLYRGPRGRGVRARLPAPAPPPVRLIGARAVAAAKDEPSPHMLLSCDRFGLAEADR